MNVALKAKLGWRLCSENRSLWTHVLVSKFIRQDASEADEFC